LSLLISTENEHLLEKLFSVEFAIDSMEHVLLILHSNQIVMMRSLAHMGNEHTMFIQIRRM
jgi:hypothetical protein